MPSNRPSNASAIERRLLDVAYTSDVEITATSLAYHAGCSIEDAASVLEDLAAHERVTMEVLDDGKIVYDVPGRPRLPAASPATPARAPAVAPSWALARAPVMAVPARVYRVSPMLAMVLTVFLPGAGHVYAGRVLAGIGWFLLVSASYALILPGLLLHLFSIGSAAGSAARANRQLLAA